MKSEDSHVTPEETHSRRDAETGSGKNLESSPFSLRKDLEPWQVADKERKRDNAAFLDKVAHRSEDGAWRFNDEPPILNRLDEHTAEKVVQSLIPYARTISPHRQYTGEQSLCNFPVKLSQLLETGAGCEQCGLQLVAKTDDILVIVAAGHRAIALGLRVLHAVPDHREIEIEIADEI